MNKFEIGDIVTPVEDYHVLKKGKLYEVIEVIGLNSCVKVKPVIGDYTIDFGYAVERFKNVDSIDLTEIESEIDADIVSNPNHYNQGNIQVIDFIQDQKLNFALGNAIKYICRCNYKGTKEIDLKKAIQYLKFELEDME